MTINLIPPKLKKEKDFKKILKLVSESLVIIFFMMILVTFTVFAVDFLTKKDTAKLEKDIKTQEDQLVTYKDIESRVTVANSKLEKIDAINSSRILWTTVLKDLANDTPKNVQMKSIAADASTGKITIAGIAATRRDIALLKEKTEESKFFKNVTFYSSSYNTTDDNYSFNLSCELENTK